MIVALRLLPVNLFIVSLAVLVLPLATSGQQSQAPNPSRNSTQKIRTKPNEMSLKAGTAIEWESDFDTAMAKARSLGRPMFWYVPTVPGTFMDRKAEIDRYMLAGPFSWPAIITMLNERTVPFRGMPTKAQVEKFGLTNYDFIEPGFLILTPDENLKMVADRLTTLHPQWLFSQIAPVVGETRTWSQAGTERNRKAIDGWWEYLEMTNWILNDEQLNEQRDPLCAETGLLSGMAAFRMGKRQIANEIWEITCKMFPNDPLAWKAANEAQGIGPFVRGFEVFGELPRQMPQERQGVLRITSTALPGTYAPQELWRRSVDFLLHQQDASGGFFDSDYDFGGTDSLPNVHVAVTALVGMALLEAEQREKNSERKRKALLAAERAAKFVADDSKLNFDDRDEIIWAQAYRVRFLAKAKGRLKLKSLPEHLQRATGQLEQLQLENGSWFHEYPNAFATGTALTALFAAQQAGATVNTESVERGLERLAKQRFASGAYPYAVRRQNESDEGGNLQASAGRIPVCELPRHQWGKITDADLASGIATGLEFHELLAKALKYDDHTSTLAYGGFFFWYDMQARSEAISRISDPEQRSRFAAQQREIILRLPEIDGAFVDSHELGRCYGTAMALLSLAAVETEPDRR